MKKGENEDPRTKHPPLKIRRMEIDDVAKVFHLGEALFKAEEAPNTYRTWDEYEVIELFYGDAEFCWVAELKKKIIGFALGSTISKSHSAWKYGYLIWLGVDPAYQRLGVAERLFKRFKEVMLRENVRMLVVDTEAENIPALKLFRKLGFRHPQQHIYLTMNLESDRQLLKKKENGGPSWERNNRNHHNT